jgi:hypothetical protein
LISKQKPSALARTYPIGEMLNVCVSMLSLQMNL